MTSSPALAISGSGWLLCGLRAAPFFGVFLDVGMVIALIIAADGGKTACPIHSFRQ